MAEQQQQQQQGPATNSATFPNPPPFLWQSFTPEKIAAFDEFRKAHLQENPHHPSNSKPDVVSRIPDVPEALINLQPPPLPEDGTWRVFGDFYTLKDELPTLEDQGLQRLVPSSELVAAAETDHNRDRALNLKRMAKSVLLNFLELVGVASINPDGIGPKVTDIQTILINMHHAINEYRPHQARESLIQTMSARLDQIRGETAAITAVTDKAKRVLEGLGSIEIPDNASLFGAEAGAMAEELSKAEKEEMYWKEQEALWSQVDAELG